MTSAKITNEERWWKNYEALKAFVAEHRQLPDKHKVDNRGLLNWWKYNMKKMKQDELSEDKVSALSSLSDMRRVKRQTWRNEPDLFSDIF